MIKSWYLLSSSPASCEVWEKMGYKITVTKYILKWLIINILSFYVN